jgi:hypothetical protein
MKKWLNSRKDDKDFEEINSDKYRLLYASGDQEKTSNTSVR